MTTNRSQLFGPIERLRIAEITIFEEDWSYKG